MALSERTKEILKSGYDYQGLALNMYEDKCDNCIELQKRIDKVVEMMKLIIELNGITTAKGLQKYVDILRGNDNEDR